MHSPQLRTSICVQRGKMDESIRFYKEILDYVVKVDVTLDQSHGEADLLGMKECTIRLVGMGAPEAAHGWIGLVEYLEPTDLKIRSYDKGPNEPFPVIFVFRTTDMDGLRKKVLALGAKIVAGPKPVQYPGKAPGRGMCFQDPNGILVDFTEFEDHLL